MQSDGKRWHPRTRSRAAAVLAATSTLILAWLAPAALATSTTIGQLAPNPFTYEYVPPYYVYTYTPPPATCSSAADYAQAAVTSGTPYVVPAGGEAITSWSTNAAAGAGQTMTLKVFRQTGASTYEAVAHDGPRALSPGTSSASATNTFAGLSLPVQPGDVIGLYPNSASTAAEACMFSSPGNSYLFSNTNLGDGSAAPLGSGSGDLLNVSAVVRLAAPPGSPSQYTLSVNTSGTGHGTVQSTPAGIESCATSCSQSFAEGTSVVLTAHPDPYSTFTGWSGGGCAGTGTCQVSLHGDTSVSAVFSVAPYEYGYGSGGYGEPAAGYPSLGSGDESVRKCRKAAAGKRHKSTCRKRTRRVARTAQSSSLGKTVLTTLKGHTLYSLSAETHGTFICTDSACLSVWHPLLVPAGVRPIGPVKLGTVTRPEGRTQVAYHGHPLYSFGGDTAPGQTNGQGLMDVGTWGAVTVPPPKHR